MPAGARSLDPAWQCTCFGPTDSWVHIRPSFAGLKLPVLATVQFGNATCQFCRAGFSSFRLPLARAASRVTFGLLPVSRAGESVGVFALS